MSLLASIPTAPLSSTPTKSSSVLTEQLDHDEGNKTPRSSSYSSVKNTTSKPRSLSDAPKPALSPSPAFREPRRISKDDSAIQPPLTPSRPSYHTRGLSLTMPSKDGSNSSLGSRVPLSPKLETSHIYGSPGSIIPRRSRGSRLHEGSYQPPSFYAGRVIPGCISDYGQGNSDTAETKHGRVYCPRLP